MNKLTLLFVIAFFALFTLTGINAAENAGVLSEKAYKRLSAAQDQLDAKQYSQAISTLNAMESMQLNNYEKALVYQTYGFVYSVQNNTQQAIRYFEQCLGLNALPEKAQQNMLLSMAGQYTQIEDYPKVISTLERWLATGATPTPNVFIIMASSYYEMNRYSDSIPWIKKAIAAKSPAKDAYYSLLISAYFETGNYSGARESIREMISRNQDELKWWRLLAGAYQQENDDVGGLAVLTAAYRKGLLTERKDIINLIKMNMFVEAPYDAAKLMEKELASGRLPSNKENLELHLQALNDSREYEKSISVINKLANVTGSGKYDLQKAQIYFEQAEWQAVIDAADSAIQRGGSNKPGEPHLLKGMALIELKNYDDAIPSLKKAQEFSSSRRNATAWLGFINEERKLIEDLAKADLTEEELNGDEAEETPDTA